MSLGDGIIVDSTESIVSLVKFGNVASVLFDNIDLSLNRFFISFKEELECFPKIVSINLPDPVVEFLGDEERTFKNELNKIPGMIVLGVTNVGIYDKSIDRCLFGFGGSSEGLLSTYRFVNTKKSAYKINERLAKEIIKILSLSLGLPHCSRSDCILSYHRSVVDLDYNYRICESCRNNLMEAVKLVLDYESKVI